MEMRVAGAELVVMRPTVLVAYASKHGSTREVAEAIAGTLHEEGLPVLIREADSVKSLEQFGAVVLGGSIYMGRWHSHAKKFVRRHHEALKAMPVALFALGYMEQDKRESSEVQLRRVLEQLPAVEPDQTAVFGGVINPAELPFPLSKAEYQDARDWDEIRDWTRSFAAALMVAA